MILHTGGRTDIVQHYSDWMFKRFKEGYVLVRNPRFPGRVLRYELTPEKVDCVVFASKDYEPVLSGIEEITRRYATYFYYTITAYGKEIEPGVPSIEKSINILKELSGLVGRQRLVWRYDPILLTEKYTVEYHIKAFERMAGQLTEFVDCCILGFVEMHRRIDQNMPGLRSVSTEDRRILIEAMGEISKKYELPIRICKVNGDYSEYGISPRACLTLEMLGKANEIQFRSLKHRGTRAGCQRMEYRDMGSYHTCTNGCKYCYANPDPDRARENYRKHDVDSPLLTGSLKPTDQIVRGCQKSFLKPKLH